MASEETQDPFPSEQDHTIGTGTPAKKTSVSSGKRPRADRLQLLANTLTILVALAAIALSLWEGLENRLHNRLSVLPHLERSESTLREGAEDSTYTMIYALRNSGLGPAVLENILLFREGEPIFNAEESGGFLPYEAMLAEIRALPLDVSASLTHSRHAGQMLQAGERHLLFRFEVSVVDSLGRWGPGAVRSEVMDRYSLVFCYCSVYGENCETTYVSVAPPSGEICRW